ncbi:MAG: Wzt carbohydrate-binding domain-containing protein, partial [Lachnospiraceae bacterium]|nr:Wzt carbohydrate-binding domain-containing protein [Lachnospiraceae bacterium]
YQKMGIPVSGAMDQPAFRASNLLVGNRNGEAVLEMTLQGGQYLLSFGVTGFEQSSFKVYHRLYDALQISVVSDKNTVGYFDMDSEVTVTESKG